MFLIVVCMPSTVFAQSQKIGLGLGAANKDSGSDIVSNIKEFLIYTDTYLVTRAGYAPSDVIHLYGLAGATYSSIEDTNKVKSSGAETTSSIDSVGGNLGAGFAFVAFETLELGIEYRQFYIPQGYCSDAVFAMITIAF